MKKITKENTRKESPTKLLFQEMMVAKLKLYEMVTKEGMGELIKYLKEMDLA